MRCAGPYSRRGGCGGGGGGGDGGGKLAAGDRETGVFWLAGPQLPTLSREVQTCVPTLLIFLLCVTLLQSTMLCSDAYDYQTYANALVKSVLVGSASTASTVAIDNKIEQAMDLVKSHLMFAVREEVEVLKEKITELLDRISQLEYENMVLRQYATQEALQKIQQHHASNT